MKNTFIALSSSLFISMSGSFSFAQKDVSPAASGPVSLEILVTSGFSASADSATAMAAKLDTPTVSNSNSSLATLLNSQASPTVDSVFARYYAATGGKSLWDSLKTYTLKRSYNSTAAADYDAAYHVSMSENAMSKSKTVMRRSFIYGIKGNQSWLKIPIGGSDKAVRYQVKDLSQSEQANMRLEMYDLLVPFMNYRQRGFVATLVGSETLDGKAVDQVELQGKGVKYNLYFDTKTGLLLRQKQTMSSDVLVTDYDKYVKSAYGILFPTTLVETNAVTKAKVTITSQLAVNEAISPEVFQR